MDIHVIITLQLCVIFKLWLYFFLYEWGCSRHHYINQTFLLRLDLYNGAWYNLLHSHDEDKLKACNMGDFYVHSMYFHPFSLHLQVSCYSNPSGGRLVFNWSTNAFSCTLTTKLPLFPGHILGTGIYIKAFAVAIIISSFYFLSFGNECGVNTDY